MLQVPSTAVRRPVLQQFLHARHPAEQLDPREAIGGEHCGPPEQVPVQPAAGQ